MTFQRDKHTVSRIDIDRDAGVVTFSILRLEHSKRSYKSNIGKKKPRIWLQKTKLRLIGPFHETFYFSFCRRMEGSIVVLPLLYSHNYKVILYYTTNINLN